MDDRNLTTLDHIISGLGYALNTVNSQPIQNARPNPSEKVEEKPLTDPEKKHAAGLMRVNHAGEIAAQGLYQGHGAVARNPNIAEQIQNQCLGLPP